MEQLNRITGFWKQLFIWTVLAAYFYVFMEWVFFVTAPSFMSVMSFGDRAGILLITGLVAAIACLFIFTAFLILNWIGIALHISRWVKRLALLAPTVILSALALLMIDNFTYTVFKFGISSSVGISRAAYALVFLVITGYIYYQVLKAFGLLNREGARLQPNRSLLYFSLAILAISLGLTLSRLDYKNLLDSSSAPETRQATRQPNILILGSDGLNAKNMSVYGYRRNTTPRLTELAKTSLVAENAFTNAGNTAGSVISIMTSKLPTQTRVLYPPDILTGVNAFQHLPGILKRLGYETVEFGVPFYIDAFSFNLQAGFDMVNNRTSGEGKLGSFGQRIGFENEVYFISKLVDRISERILHILFIRVMQNPYKLVTQPVPSIKDDQKVSEILDLFDHAQTPLFIHAHLLGTHGGYFSPKNQVFSQYKSQSQPWMTDFYDDTILGFDKYVAQVILHLKMDGQWDNTILIIYTDHNEEFHVNQRIPLIIHFPGDQYAGQVTRNAENIDIAPTILDYLGLPKPAWMDGESLLQKDANNQRLIYSMGTSKTANNEQKIFVLDPNQVKPPFYQFSFVNIIDCQKWYTFDLITYTWTSGDVQGYVDPCDPSSLLSMNEIKQALIQRLQKDGFDTSSLH